MLSSFLFESTDLYLFEVLLPVEVLIFILLSGVSFELVYESDQKSASEDVEFGMEDEMNTSLNTSCEEDFLDSIGLNKRDHFPSLETQRRLSIKSRLRSVDNKVESTIRVKNCQGLFNFLRNANFLCASSGVMANVPPTLIAPVPFEGSALSKCKIVNGPIKHHRKSCVETVIFVLTFILTFCLLMIVYWFKL